MTSKPEEHAEEVRKGEHVVYHPTGAGNVSTGTVKRIITEPEPVGGRQTVKASEEEPRYVTPILHLKLLFILSGL